MDNRGNRFYFYPKKPIGGLFFFLWGILALVMGFDTRDSFMIGWAAFLLLLSALFWTIFFKCRRSGPELDEYLKACANQVLPEALDFFKLDGIYRPDIFIEGYFFHQMPGQLPLARYGKDGLPRSDIGVALLVFVQRGRLYCYQKQFSLITPDFHVETLVLALSEITTISGEMTQVPCKTPKSVTVQVPAQRLLIRSGDGAGLELRLSSPGVMEAAARLRALAGHHQGGL